MLSDYGGWDALYSIARVLILVVMEDALWLMKNPELGVKFVRS